MTLTNLVHLANIHLADLNPRYRLETAPGSDLGLQIVDLEQDEARRSTVSSRGERLLAGVGAGAVWSRRARMSFVDTLFIDEGSAASTPIRSMSPSMLLERLHGKGRKVGVISHVEAMHERIPVQMGGKAQQRPERCHPSRGRRRPASQVDGEYFFLYQSWIVARFIALTVVMSYNRAGCAKTGDHTMRVDQLVRELG